MGRKINFLTLKSSQSFRAGSLAATLKCHVDTLYLGLYFGCTLWDRQPFLGFTFLYDVSVCFDDHSEAAPNYWRWKNGGIH
jgi:hypothetical protein